MTSENAPRRIQRQRAKGWRMPEGAISVSRPSKWGNPWKVGDRIVTETPIRDSLRSPTGQIHVREFEITPDLAVELYRQAFALDADEIRAELAGRDLVCWCPLSSPCHADVLLEIANGEPLE